MICNPDFACVKEQRRRRVTPQGTYHTTPRPRHHSAFSGVSVDERVGAIANATLLATSSLPARSLVKQLRRSSRGEHSNQLGRAVKQKRLLDCCSALRQEGAAPAKRGYCALKAGWR